MPVYEGGAYEIEFRWKEEVIYWEGHHGFRLDAGWGAQPPVLYVPSARIWNDVVPAWLQGRHAEVVTRLEEHTGHRLEHDDLGYTDDDSWQGRAARTLDG